MALKKKVIAKKTVEVKKAPVKKNVAAALKEQMTKAQVYAHLAEETGLPKKDIVAVLDELGVVIERHVKKNSIGEFKLLGLMKVKVVKKPAQKARKGTNPFTGEEQMFKAKPARNVVKVTPLKALKDMC